MQYRKIVDVLSKKISGEWGNDPLGGNAVKVLRTTNFTNIGKLNLSSVVERDIEDKIVVKKRLKYGDTIIEKSGGSPNQPVGRVVYFDINDNQTYLCNNFTAILRPTEDVFPKYYFYALFYKHLNKATLRYQNKTTGIINLQLDRYLQEEIPLPPLPIQKKIAAILEKADAAREKRRKANELTEQFLQSAFLEMFGDPVTNPKGWKRIEAEKIFEIKLGKMLDEKRFTGENPKPYLRNINVKWSKFDLSDIQEMDFTPVEFERNKLHRGDILVCEGGEVGRCAIWDEQIPDCGYQKALHRLRVIDPVIDVKYFVHFMRLAAMHGLLLRDTSQVTIAHFTAEKFRQFKILVPPLVEQQKYSTLVDKVNSLRTKQEASENELDNLFNSLMQKAFNGELVG